MSVALVLTHEIICLSAVNAEDSSSRCVFDALPEAFVSDIAEDSTRTVCWLMPISHVVIRNASDLYKALDRCAIGEEVDLEVLRDNDKMHIKIKLGSSS